jgi:hypothetical protein
MLESKHQTSGKWKDPDLHWEFWNEKKGRFVCECEKK